MRLTGEKYLEAASADKSIVQNVEARKFND